MELRGSDDLGNQVVFYMNSLREGDGIFKVDTSENGYIDEEAEKLVLPLYTAAMPLTDGRQNSVYVQHGEGRTDKGAEDKIIINIVE